MQDFLEDQAECFSETLRGGYNVLARHQQEMHLPAPFETPVHLCHFLIGQPEREVLHLLVVGTTELQSKCGRPFIWIQREEYRTETTPHAQSSKLVAHH